MAPAANPSDLRALLAAACLVLASACLEPAVDGTIVEHARPFLEANQNSDGGFPATPGSDSDFASSAWAALALAAADADAETLVRLGDFLAARSGNVTRNETRSLSATNPVALYVLSMTALGRDDDVHAHVERLSGLVDNATLALNERIFLLGALAVAGQAERGAPVRAELERRITDPSDSDLKEDAWMRSHVILALLAAGVPAYSDDMKAAARSLISFQEGEGGFRGSPQYPPDSSTTSAVVAVLAKVRFIYSDERGNGLVFVRSLQQSDGSVRFSQELDFAPTKTTAEAILGATGHGPFAA